MALTKFMSKTAVKIHQ